LHGWHFVEEGLLPDELLLLELGQFAGQTGQTGGTTCDFKIYKSSCPGGI